MTGSALISKVESELPGNPFVLVGHSQVNTYLQLHPQLVLFLHNASVVISRHFPDMQIALQVVRDPEGGSGMLFGLIQTSEEAEPTLRRLDALDNDAEWIAMYTPVRSLFIVSVGYL